MNNSHEKSEEVRLNKVEHSLDFLIVLEVATDKVPLALLKTNQALFMDVADAFNKSAKMRAEHGIKCYAKKCRVVWDVIVDDGQD